MMIRRFLTLLLFALSDSNLTAQVSDFAQTNFNKADSIANIYPHHSLANLRDLTFKLTDGLSTEEEKFRTIYKWVCNNIANDYSLNLQNQQKRAKLTDEQARKEWNKEATAILFQRLLKKHESICTGYAYLIREMSSFVGINAIIVDGYGRTIEANIGGTGVANHSWNAVQLHNKWYLCDATWSSGAVDMEKKIFIKNYEDAYFLADPVLFIRNHYPLDTSFILYENTRTLQQFLDGPLTYPSIYKFGMKELHPETFHLTVKKKETITFRFSNRAQPIQQVELQIKNPSGITSVFPGTYHDKTGLMCVDHAFRYTGTYLVHGVMDNEICFTYTVKVK